MVYATLMAHLDFGRSNERVLSVTADLAERLGAGVIGIAACQPIQISYGAGYLAGDVVEFDRDETDRELRKLHADFNAALPAARVRSEWRSTTTVSSLAGYIAHEARSADLIVTGPDHGSGLVDGARRVSIGELAMRAGRPVLIVPPAVRALDLSRAVVAWKDTREARRAVADALPLLARADRVTVVELAPPDRLDETADGLEDVTAWLARHGVKAEARALASGAGDARRLEAVVRELGGSLLVAGAYGHSRIHEWVFGGVTCDFLMHPEVCALISH